MRKLLPVVLCSVLLVVGCGGDDDDDEATSPTSSPGTITTESTIPALDPDEIDATKSPYCATWAEIRSQGGPRTEGMDDAAAAARRKEYYGTLLPIVDRLLEQSDDEIRDAVRVAREAASGAATTGSFEPFRTEEAKASAKRLAEYALDNCRA